MENNITDDAHALDEQSETPKGGINEWLKEHKGIRILVSLGMVLVFLVALFMALRSLAIYRMDHYAVYAVNQVGLNQNGGKGTPGGFDGMASGVTVVNEPDIQDCEQFVTITSGYWVSTTTDYGTKYVINDVEGYYARFSSKDGAQRYLASQDADADRNRYVLGNYYFDFPRKKDTEGLDSGAQYAAERYNEAAGYVTSNNFIGELLYRALVVFDFSTGIKYDVAQEA